MLRVGETVGGYDIVAKLRAGGMATLFLGTKRGAAGFARHVAIKVVHEHLAQDPDFVRMFVDEALLQARIQNPHVVHVEELGESSGAHFMVMEYVHGCALAQLLLALGKRRRRPQIDLAVSIALQTLAGLHAAHELRGEGGQPLGVVHRDVSPQNVLLSRDGQVKLIDFGVAKAASSSQQTQGAMLKGKLRYMPPEQAFGRPVDRRADVYALGIVLWEMLTMRRLFGGKDELELLEMVRSPQIDPPSAWSPDVGPALDRVVLKALAKDPAERFATAQEMRRALTEAVPSAALVEPSALAELIEAAVGEELEKERRTLPSAVGAQVGPATDALRLPSEEVLLTLTVSAAGLESKSGAGSLPGDGRASGSGALAAAGSPTPAPAPVSSVAVGTPSQLLSRAPSAPSVETTPRATAPYLLVAAASLLVIGGLAGGGYLLRGHLAEDTVVASPLPVPSAATASEAASPPSVPVAPSPPSAELPAALAPADGAASPATPEPTTRELAEEAAGEDPRGTADTASSEPSPPASRRSRRRGRRTTRTEGTTTVPFANEF
jgi:serine/threonine protein kinase